MTQPLLLVDFENVQTIDVHFIPSDYRIAIFCGVNQKSASLDLMTRLQDLGSRVQWHWVQGTGRNALDFHLVFHIGRVLERKEASEFVILAKDAGHDPLVKYIRSLGVPRRRAAALGETHGGPPTAASEDTKPSQTSSPSGSAELDRVKANLTRVQKRDVAKSLPATEDRRRVSQNFRRTQLLNKCYLATTDSPCGINPPSPLESEASAHE